MAMQRTSCALVVPAILALLSGAAPAQTQPTPVPSLARPAGVSGTVVVPDHFLRRWDPVTVFFAADVGPASGGPEDQPDRVVRLEPTHPGAWTWLDARTLQLKPAEPWPPLGRFTVTVEGTRQSLMTLMSAPISSLPANGAEGLEPVDGVTLTFPEPLDEAALARMVRIELRPLPGVEPGGGRFLEGEDLTIKVVEREQPGGCRDLRRRAPPADRPRHAGDRPPAPQPGRHGRPLVRACQLLDCGAVPRADRGLRCDPGAAHAGRVPLLPRAGAAVRGRLDRGWWCASRLRPGGSGRWRRATWCASPRPSTTCASR